MRDTNLACWLIPAIVWQWSSTDFVSRKQYLVLAQTAFQSLIAQVNIEDDLFEDDLFEEAIKRQ